MGLPSRLLLSFAIPLLALTTTVAGQTVRSGSISGTVTDGTGAALPGVSITLTSPALQLPQLIRVSEAGGEYQFFDLPPGTYRLAYELAGFATLVREEIRLTSGFAARVDVVLQVATVAETITVTGASPLVDVTNTRGGTTVSQQLLDATPNNNNYQDVFLLVGGVQINGAPLTGDSGLRTLGDQVSPRTYGQDARTTNTIEGIVVLPNEAPDFSSFEEVDVKTFGNTAEIPNPGAAVQLVVKSGGNAFHGRYAYDAQHHNILQSTNVDDALRAQGIAEGNTLRYYQDFSGDLGGRLVRDKLWFYGALHHLRNERTLPGYARAPGQDATYGTLDDTPGRPRSTTDNDTIKLSYQATRRHRLIAFWARNPVVDLESEASRFLPFETTTQLKQLAHQVKGEWQGTLSDRLLVNALYFDSGYEATRRPQVSIPNRLDRETSFQTGTNFSTVMGNRTPIRRRASGTVDYLPGGSHAIRAGYFYQWGTFRTNFQTYVGNYRLIYDRVGGVSHQPVEMQIQNRPVAGGSRQNLYAAFVQDQWRPSRRLTLNLGLRWERNVNWVPEQVKGDSIIQGVAVPGTSGTFPRVDAGTFWGLAPRTGVAFDLFGDGKTVVKGTYGLYNLEWSQNWNVGFAHDYNQNTVTVVNYRWRDLDGNNDYTPGEINLNPNGPDFLTSGGAINNIVNPDLEMVRTHEATGSLERELSGSLSIRGLYVYKKVVDNLAQVNVQRPYGVYNQVFTRRDPGPDGTLNTADDGGLITFYDYDPAYRGNRFVSTMLVNGSRDNSFQNFEVTLNKRQTGRWFAFTSFLATKNHRWLKSVVETPNDELFPLDATWAVTYRLAAGYQLPFGIAASTLYQAYNGIPGQRTYIFRVADPDGGPSLPSSGTITRPMEEYGARKTPQRHIVNLRMSKNFALGGARRFTANFDLFNAFNSNVPWGDVTGTGVNFQSGPTFGYVTQIVPPRAARVGVAVQF